MNKGDLLKRGSEMLIWHRRESPAEDCTCHDNIFWIIESAYLLGMQERVKRDQEVIQKRECPLCSMRGDLQRELVGNKDEWFCVNEGCPIRFYEA